MDSKVPTYMKDAGVPTENRIFEWKESYHPGDFFNAKKVDKDLRETTHYGQLLFMTTLAEWVGRIVEPEVSDSILSDYLNAVRAGIVDWRYLRSFKASGRLPEILKWRDRVRGPLRFSLLSLGSGVVSAKKMYSVSDDAACFYKFVQHVAPKPKAFNEWRKLSIERLASFYPNEDGGATNGAPIPFQLLDPNTAFEVGQETSLLNNFLHTLDHQSNPFLHTPEEMKKAGFIGSPYQMP